MKEQLLMQCASSVLFAVAVSEQKCNILQYLIYFLVIKDARQKDIDVKYLSV